MMAGYWGERQRERGRRMTGWRMTACIAVLGALALPAASCTSVPTRTAQSTTPRITTGVPSPGLPTALLTVAALSPLPGAPAGIAVSPANAAAVYQDPDPRTPCGEPAPLPDLTHAAGISISTSTLTGFEFAVDLPTTTAAAALESTIAAGTRPGCPPSSSQTNTGSSELTTLDSAIPLPGLVDSGTGAALTVSNSGQTFAAVEFLLQKGPRICLLVLFGAAAPAAEFDAALGRAAESQLARSTTTG